MVVEILLVKALIQKISLKTSFVEETIPLALGQEVEDMALTFKKSSRSDIQNLKNSASFSTPLPDSVFKTKCHIFIFITYSCYDILKVSSS